MKISFSLGKIQLFAYFIILSLAGSLLLQFPFVYSEGKTVPYIDALFTSVSALCVTGLSTLDMSVYTTAGFCVILVLIELGGLGILTFVSMMITSPGKKVSLVNRKMVKDFFIDEVENNPRKILKNILMLTFGIQIMGTLALFPAFHAEGVALPLFTAFFTSVSAFCNAGFSVFSDSLAQFTHNKAVSLIVMTLIFLGGIGFIVLKNLYQIVRKRKKYLSLHSKLALLSSAVLIAGGALFYFFSEYSNSYRGMSLIDSIIASFFQSITTRTAGFETIAQPSQGPLSNVVTIFLMFIGGSPGSIAGGVKTTTFFIAFFYLLRGNEEKNNVSLFRRNISSNAINKAISIVIKSFLIVFIAFMLLIISEQRSLLQNSFSISDLLFETVSAFGTVGLSCGVTSQLSFLGKLIIIATMFIGRTGIFAMALGSSRNIIEKRFIRYPEESVLIG